MRFRQIGNARKLGERKVLGETLVNHRFHAPQLPRRQSTFDRGDPPRPVLRQYRSISKATVGVSA